VIDEYGRHSASWVLGPDKSDGSADPKSCELRHTVPRALRKHGGRPPRLDRRPERARGRARSSASRRRLPLASEAVAAGTRVYVPFRRTCNPGIGSEPRRRERVTAPRLEARSRRRMRTSVACARTPPGAPPPIERDPRRHVRPLHVPMPRGGRDHGRDPALSAG